MQRDAPAAFRSSRPLPVIAALALPLILVACGGASSSAQLPTAPDLLSSARSTLSSTRSFQLSGSATTNEEAASITATVLHSGDAHGTLSIGGQGTDLVLSGPHTYFDALPPFVLAGMGTGAADLAQRLSGILHWWQTPGSSSAQNVLQLLRASFLDAALLTPASPMSPPTRAVVRGRSLLKISNSSEAVYFGSDSHHALVEITTSTNLLIRNLSNIDVTFSSIGAAAGVETPAKAVVPDPAQMPPDYVLKSFDFVGQCSSAGCRVTATVTTDAGSGTTTVHFVLTDGSGNQVGSCDVSAAVPALAATVDAGCRATGPSFAAYWNRGGTVNLSASLDNPNYGASGQ
ncbi:MAG: hypothetical protein JOZ46_00535 [Candidatus Dormibacteraeota bacterium]|nr:hypothetical protein [Candidatus Dormibacteraeota bacterium]